MTALTRAEAKDAVQRTLSVIASWEASDAPNVSWRGIVTKDMSPAVESALKGLFQLCTLTDVDDDAKEIVLAIDAVHSEFDAFEQARDLSPESVHPTGTPELRSTIAAMRDTLADRGVRLPEGIRDLMESGVGDEQICKIYGFLTEDNQPDFVTLSEEKTKPGTHYDPKTWVPPGQKRRRREVNELWATRKPAELFASDETNQVRKIAPEPIEDLIGMKVDAEQIALMKGMTVEAVEAFAMQNGLPLNGRTYRSTEPNANEKAKTDLANQRAELIPRSHPEISNMEDRVLACALDEMSPTDIAKALQVDYPDLSWQKVSAMIRQFNKEGEEAAENATA